MAWESSRGRLKSLDPSTHMGDLEGSATSLLQNSLTLATATLFLSLSLSLVVIICISSKNKIKPLEKGFEKVNISCKSMKSKENPE